MPRRCTICYHPEREAIDEALVGGSAVSALSAKYRTISEDALGRHKANHLPAKLVLASEAAKVANADDLLARVEELRLKAMDVLGEAEVAHDHRTMLAAIDRASKQLELLAKLLGELQQEGTTTVQIALVEHPDYPRLSERVLKALEPYEDARYAVAEALRGVE